MDFLQISFINIILWLYAAIVVGWAIDIYDRKWVSGGGMVTTFFAIIGAMVTGYLMSFVSGRGMLAFNIDALLVTAVGASVFAFFYRYSFGKSFKN